MDPPGWLDADTIVAVATVVTLIGSIIATTVSIRLTKASLDVTQAELKETRDQRLQGLLPVLVVESHAEKIPGEDWERVGSTGGPTVHLKQGVRVLNGGPGIALSIRSSVTLDDAIDRAAFELDDEDVPSALASGGHHDVIVRIDERYASTLRARAHAAGDRAVRIARVEVTYQDVFDQHGRASCHLMLDLDEDPPELTCRDLCIDRPGEQPPVGVADQTG